MAYVAAHRALSASDVSPNTWGRTEDLLGFLTWADQAVQEPVCEIRGAGPVASDPHRVPDAQGWSLGLARVFGEARLDEQLVDRPGNFDPWQVYVGHRIFGSVA